MEKHEAVSKNNAAAIPARENRRRAFRLMFSTTLFVLAASIISCKPSPDEGNWFGNILEMCLSPLSSRTEYVYEDMYDGTIRRTELQHGGTVCEGPRVYTMSVGYIKKCLQGQVYVSNPMDPDYNTCRGAGSSPDWGAVKYQFCASNNRDCDMQFDYDNDGVAEWVADPTKSPAAISCAGDATAGRVWELNMMSYRQFPVDVRILYPEMPLGITEIFWDNSPIYVDQSYTYYFDVAGKITSNYYQLKNTQYYVICSSKNN